MVAFATPSEHDVSLRWTMHHLSRRAKATLGCCVVSAAGHLALVVAVASMPAPVAAPEVTEVELVQSPADGRPPGGGPSGGTPGTPGLQPAGRGRAPSRRPARQAVGQRQHGGRPSAAPSTPSEGETSTTDEGAPGLLSMRGSADDSLDVDRPLRTVPERDRLASFRPLAGQPRGQVPLSGRSKDDEVEMLRYEDGGRLLRGDGGGGGGGGGGPPGTGQQGLLSLASSKLGGSTGDRQCDPYRRWAVTPERTLVLLVDTSGSIVAKERAPAALVCAAGAALSALRHGCEVSVVNFSSESLQIQPTRSKDAIYSVLSRVQGASTVLPRLSTLSLGRVGGPIDYVLVSDGAIHNLKDVLPDYRRAVQRRPDNRALLLVLGEEDLKSAAALQSVGFEVDAVEHPGVAFRRFATRRPAKLAH